MTVTEDTEQGGHATGDGPAGPGPGRRRAARSPASGRRRRPRAFVLLRQVEGDSVVHRLWAGTKLLAATGVSLTVSLVPTWTAVGLVAGLLLAATLVARIPAAAVPRPPRWFWIVVGAGGLLTVFSGGRPEVAVAGAHVGFGGLDSYVRFTCISVILLGAGALIGWTTSLGDIAPAVGRILAPLRWLRLPVDEWAIAIALCIRSLPILVEEIRTLVAARRLRPTATGGREAASRAGLTRLLDEGGDLLVAALSVSLRRAAEMGEAMSARGGTASISARAPGPARRDAVAMLVVAGVCSAGWLLPG